MLRRDRRGPTRTWGLVAVALFSAIGLALVISLLDEGGSAGHGDLVDHVSSADGRYEVRVLHWRSVIGEDGWDVVIRRTGRFRSVDAYAGCLFSEESGAYDAVQSVEAGSVRIATENGPVPVAFDPDTMQVTRRIPVSLCQGYG